MEHKCNEAKLREERLWYKEAVEMKFWIADQRQLWYQKYREKLAG